jgi:hypothetical protein
MMAATTPLGKKKCALTVRIHGLQRAITLRRMLGVSDLVFVGRNLADGS